MRFESASKGLSIFFHVAAFVFWATKGAKVHSNILSATDGSAFLAGPVLVWTVFVVVFIAAGTVFAIFDTFPGGPWAPYKIHRKDTMTATRMLAVVCLNFAIGYASVGMLWWSGCRGYHEVELSWHDDGMDWVSVVTVVTRVAMQLMLSPLSFSTVFFAGHYLLHFGPRALRRVHRLHHSTYASVGLSGMYMHPVDFIATQGAALAAPTYLISPPLVLSLFLATECAVSSVLAHSGYDLPGAWAQASDHELHHNFSLGRSAQRGSGEARHNVRNVGVASKSGVILDQMFGLYVRGPSIALKLERE